MDNFKKPYEISIWEDYLVHPGDASDPKEKVRASYYDERKIAIIGSDTMNVPWRAVNASFTKNVNGSHTLMFTMYSKYYDDETDEILDNPFTKLMVNERKVKLKYDNEWYDFIIKNIQESSDQRSYTYTAKDLFVNELSKNGFALTLDEELNNNTGTIIQLAETILDGTDWVVEASQSDIIQQKKEEPLYEITLSTAITAKNMIDGSTISLSKGDIIYGFYSCYVNKTVDLFQFLYSANGYKVDDDRVILDVPNYYILTVGGTGKPTYIDSGDGTGKYNFEVMASSVTSQYRGERLVRSVKTLYDKALDKYVTVYREDKFGNPDICGYTETEYIDDTIVENWVSNSSDFSSTDGWMASSLTDGNNDYISGVKISTIPDLHEATLKDGKLPEFTSYLSWTCTDINPQTKPYLLGRWIIPNRSKIRDFVKDEVYIFRAKIYNPNNLVLYSANAFNVSIADYVLNAAGGTISVGDTVYFKQTGAIIKDGYIEITLTCQNELNYDQFLSKNNIGLLIQPTVPFVQDYGFYIEEIQLFKLIEVDGKPVYPLTGDSIPLTVADRTRTKYYYYKYNKDTTDPNSIVYVYTGYTPDNTYQNAVVDEKCEKKRSIKASESNRFNLLQELCETFECWIKFEIGHDPGNGKILLKKETVTDENGESRIVWRQDKKVSFHEYIGKDNYAGFRYGINLKSTARTLDSDAIVSKLIVKANSNEYAPGGFCSIATSNESESGETFILDFTHYYTQGLLNINEVTNDLYVPALGIGYLTRLKQINNSIKDEIEEQSALVSSTLPALRSATSMYEYSMNQSDELVMSLNREFMLITGMTIEQFIADKTNNWWNQEDVVAKAQALIHMMNQYEEYRKLYEANKKLLDEAEARAKVIAEDLEAAEEKKEKINREFYDKYSRFIQEGSWISEDYIDDDLYYLDAESTLHTSSQPKVTYTINVVEVSQLEGLAPYKFDVGDKTYIEDVEFFGYVMRDGRKSPYHEEVIVSEVKFQLDSPEQNTIKVQNYKTQFEDLFQRIAATTTSVQFSTGDYQRAAAAIQQNGTINGDVLQNSFYNNSIILQNSNNNSITWDESGITTIDLNFPNKVVRIVGGGIFLSTDYGSTWNTGITGSGINANFITAGQIDTGVVRIMDGATPTFRWDTNGITAYNVRKDEDGNVIYYSQNNFVRFDQYGVYAIDYADEDGSFNPSIPNEFNHMDEDKIADSSRFYITRKGFGLKTNTGAVTITNTDDFQVFDDTKAERVHIGRIADGAGGSIYGLQLKDSTGQITLENTSEGTLYLKDKIIIGPGPDIYDSRVTLGAHEFYYTEHDGHKKGDKAPREEADYSKIFSVKNINKDETIAFYDDGKLVATNVEVTGTIYATGGQIGNMTIDQVEKATYRVVIESSAGQFVAPGESATLTARLYRGEEEIAKVSEGKTQLTYTWYKDGTQLATSEDSYTVTTTQKAEIFDIKCEIKYVETGETVYTGFFTLAVVDDGNAIDHVETFYAYSKNEIDPATIAESDWKTNINDLTGLSNGDFLYVKNVTYYTQSGNVTVSYSKTRYGDKGDKGDKGEKGDAGQDAIICFRYSPYSDGINPSTKAPEMSETPNKDSKYIGIYSGTEEPARPDDPSTYIWSEYRGDDGVNAYIYVRYSPYTDGHDLTEKPDENSKYIGVYTGSAEPEDPNDPNIYSWSEYKGHDGAPGKDGTNAYIYIRYSLYSNGRDGAGKVDMSETPDEKSKYIGIYTGSEDLTTEQKNNPDIYIWSEYKGRNAQEYQIVFSPRDKFYKFYTKDEEGVEHFSLSPEDIVVRLQYIEDSVPSFVGVEDYKIEIESLENRIYTLGEGITISENELLSELVNVEDFVVENDGDKTKQSYLIKLKYFLDETSFKTTKINYTVGYSSLQRTFKTENCCLIIKIKIKNSENSKNNEDKVLAREPLLIEFGTSDEMATFAMTAADIQAAINGTGMVFNADGLTIKNGGFRIEEEYETGEGPVKKDLFYYDNVNHSMYIDGNGYFSGTIYATNGEFTGVVHATDGDFTGKIKSSSGEIGGFYINSEGLYSLAGCERAEETGEIISCDKANVRLEGIKGGVYAKNLELGEGAKLERSLDLGGNVVLWNSEHVDSNGTVLEVFETIDADTRISKIKITKDGIMNLGEIKLDGNKSEIYGNNFSITPDFSYFNNVAVSGKISTSVFEVGHVQAVGGSMIFKQSYKVSKQNSDIEFVLDSAYLGQAKTETEDGDSVFLLTLDGLMLGPHIVTKITTETDPDDETKSYSVITIDANSDRDTIVGIITIGQASEKPVIVAVNSENNLNREAGLFPRGLAVSEFSILDDKPNTDVKAFLGDLDFLRASANLKGNMSGYGLYSSNVYLTGSLMTFNKETGLYAGVSTLNGVANDDEQDRSPIVFWAGADLNGGLSEEEAINKSSFKVTENGTFYANNGHISDSVVVDCNIRGGDIYTARIHGISDTEPGLSLYSTDYNASTSPTSIAFFDGKYQDSQRPAREVFRINNTGFALGNTSDYFIQIKSDTNKVFAEFYGGLKTEISDSSYVYIKDTAVGFYSLDNERFSLSLNQLSGINVLTLLEGQSNKVVDFSYGNNYFYSLVSHFSNNVYIGERLRYTYEEEYGGYNLYIYDDTEVV